MRYNLATRSNARNIFDIMNEFDDMINQAWGAEARGENYSYKPSLDFHETDFAYIFSFDLPGVKKEDVKIDLSGNVLTLTGERKYSFENKNKSNYTNEKYYGQFKRSFTLPAEVDTEKAEAHFENGVLEIAVPKKEVAKVKTVQIQDSKSGIFSKLLGTDKTNKQ